LEITPMADRRRTTNRSPRNGRGVADKQETPKPQPSEARTSAVKEYDIVLPLYYNDGTPIELAKFQDLAKVLIADFGGVTFFPQSSEGWRKKGEEFFQDKNVLFRVLGRKNQDPKRAFARLKGKIKADFRQEEVLIVQREVQLI